MSLLPPLRRSAFALGALLLFDLGFVGQGLLSVWVAVVGCGVLLVGVVWAIVRGRPAVARNRSARAAMYLLLGLAAVGMIRFHAATAEAHAAQVIEACRAYQAKRGALPDRLQDLVPDFLPSVPRTKYSVMWHEFAYWHSNGTSHTLMYIAVPPFGRRLYNFEEDRWGRID